MSRVLSLVLPSLLASSCSTQSFADAGCQAALFGRPVAQTGLSADQCKPSCECGAERWDSPEWTTARLDALRSWTLETPFAEVTVDPYASPAPPPAAGVCAVVATDLMARRYRVETFPTVDAAHDAGAFLTHHGACGVCSTLEDLRVYAADPDLGAPVKQCGLDTFSQGFEANVQCLQRLGFTRPCAQIWAWNTANTRRKCLEPCVLFGGDPYHLPDGGLNACLACDEKESGPVFKAVAGRTRRNTGIASAMCRPCSEAAPVPHDYP
ncbi:MAG: hypothetical protein AB1938_32815 [Myxococcota bacterium]